MHGGEAQALVSDGQTTEWLHWPIYLELAFCWHQLYLLGLLQLLLFG
jgi:hypothetical protein